MARSSRSSSTAMAALFWRKDHAQHYPTGDGPVVDATGAGDAFDAAFLAHYRRDGDLAKAAQFANDIGSWVVARYGARPPVDAELKELISQLAG